MDRNFFKKIEIHEIYNMTGIVKVLLASIVISTIVADEDVNIYNYAYRTPSPLLLGKIIVSEKQGRESHCAIRSSNKLHCSIKARSHQIKIVANWLQTGSWLASDEKIGVNGTVQDQCNPTAFC